jgi:hypothetical protein
MKIGLLALCISAGLLTAAEPRMSDDMRRAIEWERYKDLAAARQAARERNHPSVTYGEANRSAEPEGRRVIDPGPPAYRKDHPQK